MTSRAQILVIAIIGVVFLTNTVSVALLPDAVATDFVNHVSTLVSIGVLAWQTLRNTQTVKEETQANRRAVHEVKQETAAVRENVDGNLSAMLRLLAQVNLTDEQLEEVARIEKTRQTLDRFKRPSRYG